MREIKFRAWHKEEKKYYKVDTIYFQENEVTVDKDWHYIIPLEDVILEQYTGLKDKNGKEIYFGDIVDIGETVNGCSEFVIFKDELGINARYNSHRETVYQYNLRELLDVDLNPFDYGEKSIVVIGNIHENGELVI